MPSDALSQLEEAIQPNSPTSPRSLSDKENPRRIQKQSTARMAPSQTSKRRRLGDRAPNSQSQVPSSQRNNDKRYYDPDQDIQERRDVRKRYRNLTHNLNGKCCPRSRESRHESMVANTWVSLSDSHAEYLQTGNDGLRRTVEDANRLFSQVKQTSDATIDSRLLVNAADLSHRKTAQLTLGD